MAGYEASPSPAARPTGAAVPAPPAPVPAPNVTSLQPPVTVGFRLASAADSELPAGPGAARVGAQVQYLWPTDGWVRGRVRRVCRQASFNLKPVKFTHRDGVVGSSSVGRRRVRGPGVRARDPAASLWWDGNHGSTGPGSGGSGYGP